MNKIGNYKRHTSKELKSSPVSIGFECLDRELFNPDRCYDLLGRSGIKHARCQTGWARCEREKGVYDFEWLDRVADNLISRGVTPWFSVSYGNPLYMEDIKNPTAVGCVPVLYGKTAVSAWENYTARLAEHFKGRVTHFEIWNEPDSEHFWYPSAPDAEMYARFVETTGSIIRKIIPDARIGACVSRFNFGYIQKFARSIRKGAIDFYSFHCYGLVPEYLYRQRVGFLKKIFRENGLEDVELWQGEGGYPSWFPKNHWLCPKTEGSERQQAVWQLRRFFLDFSEGIKRSSFFQMADMMERPYNKASEVVGIPARHGILNGIEYTPKKSYETLGRLAEFFSGDMRPTDDFFAGFFDADVCRALSVQLCSFMRNGFPMYAYWLPTDIEAEESVKDGFWVNISDSRLSCGIKEPVLLDMFTGEVFEIDSENVNLCNYDGVISIKNLPIADYPMVICDRRAIEIEDKI